MAKKPNPFAKGKMAPPFAKGGKGKAKSGKPNPFAEGGKADMAIDRKMLKKGK
jgi:hypothetical protein